MAEHLRLGAPIVIGNCKRCGRCIVLKTPKQEYGPKCAKKVTEQGAVKERYGEVQKGVLP